MQQDRAAAYRAIRMAQRGGQPQYRAPPLMDQNQQQQNELARGIGSTLPAIGTGTGALIGGLAAASGSGGIAAPLGAGIGGAIGGALGGVGQMGLEQLARGSEGDYERRMLEHQIMMERQMLAQSNKDRALQLALAIRPT